MASTVGTIMALLVFLTFLSLITNQYVPVWMKDSEAGHMGEALGQMGVFKSNIDLQTLAAQTAQIVNRHYIPVTTFSSVKLGVDGVPIFSSPTIGELTINQTRSAWSLWFQYSISGNATTVAEGLNCVDSQGRLEGCGGNVRLHVFNRYFPQQSIVYENGALIRAQADGQVVKGEPSFRAFVANNSAEIDFTLIDLFGTGGVAGIGAEGIQARVISVDLQEYGDLLTDVYVNASTAYGPAWFRFLNDTLGLAYGVPAAAYQGQPGYDFTAVFEGKRAIQLQIDNPYFSLRSIWNPILQRYSLVLQFKFDSPSPISTFRVLHAYVNVAAGERGNEVGL